MMPLLKMQTSEVLKASDFSKLEKLINFIEEKGEITPKEVEAVSGKSAATARRYLKIYAVYKAEDL